jgi:hypothetical protein
MHTYIVFACLVLLAQAQQAPTGYSAFSGDCPGNDIALTDSSLHDCADNCDSTPNCAGFSFRAAPNRKCWTKSVACASPSSSSDYTFYRKAPTDHARRLQACADYIYIYIYILIHLHIIYKATYMCTLIYIGQNKRLIIKSIYLIYIYI